MFKKPTVGRCKFDLRIFINEEDQLEDENGLRSLSDKVGSLAGPSAWMVDSPPPRSARRRHSHFPIPEHPPEIPQQVRYKNKNDSYQNLPGILSNLFIFPLASLNAAFCRALWSRPPKTCKQ